MNKNYLIKDWNKLYGSEIIANYNQIIVARITHPKFLGNYRGCYFEFTNTENNFLCSKIIELDHSKLNKLKYKIEQKLISNGFRFLSNKELLLL